MSSSARRSLVFVALLSLLFAASGAVAPAALAGPPPTNTRVAGINIDATTIPQLQSLMDRHRLTSVQLVQFYTHRITKLNGINTAAERTTSDCKCIRPGNQSSRLDYRWAVILVVAGKQRTVALRILYPETYSKPAENFMRRGEKALFVKNSKNSRRTGTSACASTASFTRSTISRLSTSASTSHRVP